MSSNRISENTLVLPKEWPHSVAGVSACFFFQFNIISQPCNALLANKHTPYFGRTTPHLFRIPTQSLKAFAELPLQKRPNEPLKPLSLLLHPHLLAALSLLRQFIFQLLRVGLAVSQWVSQLISGSGFQELALLLCLFGLQASDPKSQPDMASIPNPCSRMTPEISGTPKH